MAKIGTVFERDQQIIQKLIGPQLQKSRNVKVSTNGGAVLSMNYCIIDACDPSDLRETILLLPGFGSGWAGVSKLGYDLAKLGYQVCMPSLPGYGNSDNPFLKCYPINETRWADVEVLRDFIGKVFPDEKLHLVGHSMGAEIITRFAFRYPKNVSSLTLLCPAGFEKRGMVELLAKFVINGMRHAIAFRLRGDKIWAELKNYLPKEKSAFAFSRWRQRFGEWRRLCKNGNLQFLEKIPPEIPICYLGANLDTVYPPKSSSVWEFAMLRNAPSKCWTSHQYHNVTMLGSENTAEAIRSFIQRYF